MSIFLGPVLKTPLKIIHITADYCGHCERFVLLKVPRQSRRARPSVSAAGSPCVCVNVALEGQDIHKRVRGTGEGKKKKRTCWLQTKIAEEHTTLASPERGK